MTLMFIVAGKFFKLEGRESAIFLKEGLESSLLSSMSRRRQQMLSGYLFLTMFNLFSSQLQLILFFPQSQTSRQGDNRHSWIIDTANDHTPALELLEPYSPILLSSSGAKKTSSQCSPFRTAIALVGVGNSLESITLGSGRPFDSPKQMLLSLTLVFGMFWASKAAQPLSAPQIKILISSLVKNR